MVACLVATQIGVGINDCFAEQVEGTARSIFLTPPSHAAESSSSNSARSPSDAAPVRVFDNALLDRLFAKDRAAAKQQAKTDEAQLDPNAERSPPQPATIPPALLLPNDSFAAKITSRTPSTLAAALRFAERGRKEINSGQYHKAVNYFERAVSLGVRNYLPYIYYYLAQSHFHLANYQSAFNFLDVAESWLSEYSEWMRSIATLRQNNVTAMGFAQAPSTSRIR
jgi:tetratricopeptide (TPR) repeat protein